MANEAPTSTELEEKILSFLRVGNRFINSSNVFQNLLENKYVDSHYRFCQVFSENTYINRHDKRHALKTTLFGLRLFDILQSVGSLRSSSNFMFATLSPLYNFTLEEACTIIIVSTYCHDIYKYFEKKHPEQAGLILHNIREDVETIYPENFDTFSPILERCIWNHSGKRNAMCAEEGIVMLADGVDCAKDRLSRSDVSPEEVMRHDEKPIEYFSCQEITSTQILRGTDRPVFANFRVEGKASWHQIHGFIERLKKSQLQRYFKVNVYWRDFIEPISLSF